MSDVSGIGGIAQAAVSLTEYVLGTQTHTSSDTSGNTTSSNSAQSVVNDNEASDVKTTGTSTTDTTSDTDTKTSNVVQNSTDPGVLSMLKQLASTAINNSTDPNATTGLLSGILQQAGDAMTSIFGQQKQAGIYNSASATSQNNDILSRAAAEAAQAILGYKTTEQGIADTALNQAGQLTSSTTTTGDVDTKNNTVATTNTNSDAYTTSFSSASTATQGNSAGTSQSKTSSSSKSGLSVVCTWMHKNKQLSSRKYFEITKHFLELQPYSQDAYLTIARFFVKELERDHTSLASRIILSIFAARTREVCALRGVRSCRPSYYGKFARSVVAVACFFPGLYHYYNYLKNKTSDTITARGAR